MVATRIDNVVCAVVCGCLLFVGCGTDGDLAGVSGQVTLDGEPLVGASIEFIPTSNYGEPSSAVTDERGRYQLMRTFRQRGARPGEYLVVICTAGPTAGGTCTDEDATTERVPACYNTQTELVQTVEPGKNKFDFELVTR